MTNKVLMAVSTSLQFSNTSLMWKHGAGWLELPGNQGHSQFGIKTNLLSNTWLKGCVHKWKCHVGEKAFRIRDELCYQNIIFLFLFFLLLDIPIKTNMIKFRKKKSHRRVTPTCSIDADSSTDTKRTMNFLRN